MKTQDFAVSIAAMMILSSPLFAVESVTRGQLQLQANYLEPEVANNAHWTISMPSNYIGITAVEQLSSSALMGHWQVGIDPLADGAAANFYQQEAYLNWRQGVVSLWAGRLPTLEQTYLENFYSGLMSLPDKGVVVANQYADSETKAVRLDATSGQYLVFSGQWVIDETVDKLAWSAATAVSTPEGTVSLTYRKPEGEEAIWGNQITWKSGGNQLSAVWMYQDEVVGYDIELRVNLQQVQTFAAYSRDLNDETRWAVGVHQLLSEAVTNYSELIWWTDSEQFQWSTGFQIQF